MLVLKSLKARPYLVELFNSLASSGDFPNNFKIAKIKKYKNGDPSEAENYHPIRLLLAISKIFEKFSQKRLLCFFKKHKLLSVHQYGFQPKKSCMGAILKLTEHLRVIKEERELAFAAFIDFKETFDTVDPSILLKNLNSFGIGGKLQQLFPGYLKNRYQLVLIENSESLGALVSYGVPQGCCMEYQLCRME